jgi:predicted O-methyltransferase YrrM
MNTFKLREHVATAAKILLEYSTVETSLYGGMHPKAAQLWGYLFAIQCANCIAGDLMEIGVFRGWGSYLPARYCRPDEKIVLVDIAQHHLDLSKTFLTYQAKVHEELIESLLVDSAAGLGLAGLLGSNRRFRWIHIDGEHSYAAVMQDLDSAARLASTDAVICVDDVDHPLAPGINDALLDWLGRNRQWKLLLRGYNKAYIVSVRSRLAWSQYVNFLPDVFRRFFSSSILLASQTQSSDAGYFSYGEPFDSKSYLKVNQTVPGIEDFEGVSPRSFLLGENCRPTMLVFGNCQMNALHGALVAASSLCGMNVRFEYVKDVHEATIEDAERLKNIARNADGIICQKVSGDKFMIRTDELLDCLPNKLTITVPSMHFNAYWPNHADLQITPGSPHCMPVDALVYKSICAGRSDSEIIDMMNSPNLYKSEDVLGWLAQAAQRLRFREQTDQLTIRISDYLEKSAASERLFYIFNHPKKKVVDYVLRLLIRELGKTFEPRNSLVYLQIESGELSVNYDMSMIDFIEIPPLVSVCDALGLPLFGNKNNVYRYTRQRGSHEVHVSSTLEDELNFVRTRIATISDSQRNFNNATIAATSLPPSVHI